MKARGYEALQASIRAGQAVFFFGAGMSIDGEGNTAARLIRRLLIRFRAMTRLCIEERIDPEIALELRRDFYETFLLPRIRRGKIRLALREGSTVHQALERYLDGKVMDVLCERYYDFNEWICLAYQRLMPSLEGEAPEETARRIAAIARREAAWMKRWGKGDAVALQEIDPVLIEAAGKEQVSGKVGAGKALFLDTMGFREQPRIMGGAPLVDDLEAVELSYRHKLQERHWVVARFAREGWCPLLVTTNFDRLLEGALRLSGFHRPGETNGRLPPLPVPAWVTVASPTSFFTAGGRGRTATLLKLHGCGMEYEKRRGEANWSSYLPRMVFTFREIQNWREDAWSRDFLRTLLRSRVMVFCGYSMRDPVIHDTLRSVYEEMGREWLKDPAKACNADHCAPAYVLAAGGNNHDFHGLEVLRAATTAAAGKTCTRDAKHPNYLRHRFRGKRLGLGPLPDTDDVFLWTYHRAYREAQAEWLEQEIHAVLTKSLNRRPDGLLVQRVLDRFADKLKAEAVDGEALMAGPTDQFQLYRIIRWSYRFHPNLLREFACLEAGQRGAEYRGWLREMRSTEHYYFPASARPAWTVTGVLLELAMDRIAAAAGCEVFPGLSNRPALLFQNRGGSKWASTRLPSELIIQQASLPGDGAPLRSRGARMVQTVWELGPSSCPWPVGAKEAGEPEKFRRPFHRAKGKAPGMEQLWEWASADSPAGGLERALRWVGLNQGNQDHG
ncbi:SIR2 family NAD-dependent protein deacylase [Luteolibacter marinus]|uniref:SIR2 family NAD-dependent protein deacylase n=1 Tax=Luteolibacter marinus TaxID=2776705 RepID=UPI001867E50A|nr:SIR2 family protein [Luteolibacter marinus]